MVVSGADDCTIKIWDPRKKGQAVTLNNTYQVTAVSFNDTSEQVITGGIDNDIKVNYVVIDQINQAQKRCLLGKYCVVLNSCINLGDVP